MVNRVDSKTSKATPKTVYLVASFGALLLDQATKIWSRETLRFGDPNRGGPELSAFQLRGEHRRSLQPVGRRWRNRSLGIVGCRRGCRFGGLIFFLAHPANSKTGFERVRISSRRHSRKLHEPRITRFRRRLDRCAVMEAGIIRHSIWRTSGYVPGPVF